MRATPFYLHLALSHRGSRKTRPPVVCTGCHICGAKPVLRVSGGHGYCQHHAVEAWAAQAKVMGTKWD